MLCIYLRRSSSLISLFFFSTGFCVLKGTFPAASIDPYSGNLALDQDVSELPVLSLKQAAEIAGPGTEVWVCSCHTDCTKRTCPCKNHGKQCTVDCHGARKCKNIR